AERHRLEGSTLSEDVVRSAKRMGFSDAQIAHLCNVSEESVGGLRRSWGLRPVYKSVDTCAAEFEAQKPYFYSTYEDESEIPADRKPTLIILAAGQTRNGQGIEFDYCCVHACLALRVAASHVVKVNCNPESGPTGTATS